MQKQRELARKAVSTFPITDYADRRSVIHLRKSWARAMLQLGDKWICAIHKRRDMLVLLVCLATIPVQIWVA